MGLSDRPYWSGQQKSGGFGGQFARGVTFGMPKPTRVVKYLLVINLAVFLAQLILRTGEVNLSAAFGVTTGAWWQVWRYVTFQFLHSMDILFHLGLNMLGLYMLGTPLERQWGGKRFLRFYLTCGIVAGIAYVVVGKLVGLPDWLPLIGASGGVYGILLACAVLFPQFRLIMFLFPVPIRFAALLIFGGMAFYILMSLGGDGGVGGMFWSHVAHLGGAAAAAVWIWLLPAVRLRSARTRESINRGAWHRKIQKRQAEQAEIDSILAQIRDQGINSLSEAQRRKLRQATHRQRQQEKDLYHL